MARLDVTAASTVVSAGTDLTGVVTDAVTGGPVYGIGVEVYDAASGAWVEAAVTDSAGRYAIDDLEGHTSVKVLFSDYSAGGADLAYLERWNGGATSRSTAAPVTLAPGAPVTLSTALARSAGILGSTSNPSGGAPFDGDVVVYDADTDIVGVADVRDDGSFFVGGLNPGESYKVRVTGAYDYPGNDGDVAPRIYFDTWYADGSDFTSAKALTAGASGTWTYATGIRLRDALVALVAPRVTGSWIVNGTLTASKGRWNRSAGSTFTYEWLRGGTVVGTGSTYRPVAADAGQPIALRVTNTTVFGHEQRVATATSSAMVVKYAGDAQPRITWVKKGKQHVARVIFRVSTDGREPAAMVTGTIAILERKHKVARLRVRNGKATFVVSKPGNHSFTYTYSGNSTTGSKGGFHVRVEVVRPACLRARSGRPGSRSGSAGCGPACRAWRGCWRGAAPPS